MLSITDSDLQIPNYKIDRIHKWRTRGKKLVPSHESEALEDKQKLQMKTFCETTGRPESQQYTGSQIIRICIEIYLKIDKTVKMYENSY